MKRIDGLLKKQNLSYSDISEYFDDISEADMYKIVNNITRFTADSQKEILKRIIDICNDEKLINHACLKIIQYIDYDYEYYKAILMNTSVKLYTGQWIEKIEYKLIEDAKNTLSEVFEDFSRRIPNNLKFDKEIISKFLDIYNKKYLRNVKIENTDVVTLLKRFNHVILITPINLLNLFYDFDMKYKFSMKDIGEFACEFCFDYPYIVEKFLEKEVSFETSSKLIKYLKFQNEKFQKEMNLKMNLAILKPNNERLVQYGKRQAEINKEVSREAQKQSMLKYFKPCTILYGRKYGIIVNDKIETYLQVNEMKEFKYEYTYPLTYVIDPVMYNQNLNK